MEFGGSRESFDKGKKGVPDATFFLFLKISNPIQDSYGFPFVTFYFLKFKSEFL